MCTGSERRHLSSAHARPLSVDRRRPGSRPRRARCFTGRCVSPFMTVTRTSRRAALRRLLGRAFGHRLDAAARRGHGREGRDDERFGGSRLAWFRDSVERLERTVGVGEEGQAREVARHHDAFAELAEARLGPLAAGEGERELGVAAPGGRRQREPAAEARVDVGDVVARRRSRGSTGRSPARRARASPRRAGRTRSALQSRIVCPLIDSPPFDSIIVRGIAFRQRPSQSQKTSIENSSPRQNCCTHDSTGV